MYLRVILIYKLSIACRSLFVKKKMRIIRIYFQNAFAAVNYRKFWDLGMEDFVKQYNIDDVIVMPYLIATQTTDGNSFFKNQFRDQ